MVQACSHYEYQHFQSSTVEYLISFYVLRLAMTNVNRAECGDLHRKLQALRNAELFMVHGGRGPSLI